MQNSTILSLIFLNLILTGVIHADFEGGGCNNKDSPLHTVTPMGIIEGKIVKSVTNKPVEAYLGIPFAKPPIGELRFKRPVPLDEKFKTPYQATKLPNACPQEVDPQVQNFSGWDMWNPNTPISEDCLYLNIWVPSYKFEGKLKIYFWIYGGGFYGGSSSLDVYDGATLAAETNSIVVSIQYRVGVFGFLNLGIEDAPGNQGLLDQNMALRWVHDNIYAFGGDPDEVTIFGESAGSASVSYQLLSPMSNPYFKRAILMSGVATAHWAFENAEKSIDTSYTGAINAGCAKTNSNDSNIVLVECLRKKSQDELLNIQFNNVKPGFPVVPLKPTIDNYFIRDTPLNLLKKAPSKDIIIGNTGNEGSYFLTDKISADNENLKYEKFLSLLQDVYQDYNRAQRDAIVQEYTDWEHSDNGYKNLEILSRAYGDTLFVCTTKEFANLWAKNGSNVYYYYFTHNTLSDPWAKWMGAKHGYEVEYFFGKPLNQKLEYSTEERLLSHTVLEIMNSFATTGIPSPLWKKYTESNPVYLDLNATIISTRSSNYFGPRARECEFWNSFIPYLKGIQDNCAS